MESLVKPFSSFKAGDGLGLLGLGMIIPEDDAAFEEELMPMDQQLLPLLQTTLSLQTVSDLMDHLGKDLALRFIESDATEIPREAVRRELISPLIFAACAMVSGVRVLAELPVNGLRGRGNVDWALVFRNFSIVVVEVGDGCGDGWDESFCIKCVVTFHIMQAKLHDMMEDHVGQLAAEMKCVRDEFELSILGKRKRETNSKELKNVRMFELMIWSQHVMLMIWSQQVTILGPYDRYPRTASSQLDWFTSSSSTMPRARRWSNPSACPSHYSRAPATIRLAIWLFRW